MTDELTQAYNDFQEALRAGDADAIAAANARLGELVARQTAAPDLPEVDDEIPIEEQRAEVLRALYDAASSGNVNAALKWLELHPESLDPQPVEEPAPNGKKRARKAKAKAAKKDKEKPLTVREERFVEHYFGDSAGNGTDAARKGGYAGNDNVLAVTASRLLRKPKIQRLVQARLDQATMPLEHILKILGEQARGTAEFFLQLDPGCTPEFSLKKAADLGKLHLIKGIAFHDNGTIRSIQWYSSSEAAKALANIHRQMRAPKPKPEAGDSPEEAARAYEIQRDQARRAVVQIMEKFNLTEPEAAKRAVKFFPAAREWLGPENETTEAVN